jgi:hypothetical protein
MIPFLLPGIELLTEIRTYAVLAKSRRTAGARKIVGIACGLPISNFGGDWECGPVRASHIDGKESLTRRITTLVGTRSPFMRIPEMFCTRAPANGTKSPSFSISSIAPAITKG